MPQTVGTFAGATPLKTIFKPGTWRRRGQTPRSGTSEPAHVSEPAVSIPTGAGPLRITASVLEQIRHTIGCLPAETGGMLGGRSADGVVTHFYFDGTAERTGITYTPDTRQVNRVLSHDWNSRGIDLLGFVHSHPPAFQRPSSGDLRYAHAICGANPAITELSLPIVATIADAGTFGLCPYAVVRDGAGIRLESRDLITVDEPDGAVASGMFATLPLFERVRSAYDLDRLERSRVIAVGCGGAASFIEDLARTGVGEFVLVDPDIVSETNLATQQTYRSDIGRPKVDCLANRIRDINPYALVVACWTSLDALDDVEFCHLARAVLTRDSPASTLLCGMTDDFYAQARVNRLALNFGLPSLCAQVYAEGRGAEVTFTHPQTTQACHRCILGSRYRAYLEEGFVNDVGSSGTPYYSTLRLNALKQLVAMALLHHGSSNPRWGGMLKGIGHRNLIQLRLDPHFSLPGIDTALAGSDCERFFADDPIWLSVATERSCVDCRGRSNTLPGVVHR